MLEISNISKVYRRGNEEFIALQNVSLRIERGHFIVVTGASGAGKSTLLNAIGGLIHPDSGDIIYNGENVYKQGRRSTNEYRKRHVGFMFQQFHLMPYLTVQDNVRLSCHNNDHLESINVYLERCSLDGLRNKFPSELSVGEKQRTAFVRAIISCPDLLLADEPTGNLDPENSNILMSLVEDYHKRGGTVVIVSHDILVSKYATERITLAKGRIIP